MDPIENQDQPEAQPAKKWANKYNSPEELETGYVNSDREAKNLVAQLRQAEARARTAEMAMEQFAPQRTNPLEEARGRYASGEATPEDLDLIIQTNVQGQVQRTLQPFFNAAAAQAALDPTLLSEAQTLLATEPTLSAKYQRIVAADPEAGSEYLSAQVRLRRSEAGMHQEDSKAQAAKASARRDAGLIGASGSVSRDAAQTSDTTAAAARRKELIEGARQSKDFHGLSKELFKGMTIIHDAEEGPTQLS